MWYHGKDASKDDKKPSGSWRPKEPKHPPKSKAPENKDEAWAVKRSFVDVLKEQRASRRATNPENK